MLVNAKRALAIHAFSVLLGTAIMNMAVPGQADAQTPRVDILPKQISIIIGRGQTDSIPLKGSVHDANFFGDITLSPPTKNACSIFINGQNTFVSLSANQAAKQIATVSVKVPEIMSTQTFTCILNYVALVRNSTGVLTDQRVDSGNTVTLYYTVKK